MANSMLKIGLIGAGRIGKVHAEAICTRVDSAELAAVSDVHFPAAQALAEKWRIPQVHQDHCAILADPSIDAVAICSSTDTHAQIIIDAAQAGKHIFCEKPIDHSLEKIDAALAAVERTGVKLMVGFNRRFDANFRRVKDLVAEGEIGAPRILRITSRDPAPPPVEYIKVSGGIFLDMTIHDFDMARYLMGSEVTQVFAAGSVLVDAEIGKAGDIDTAITTLWFANGAIGTIDNCREAAYGYDQRVEVFGAKGMAQAENNTPDRHILSTKDGVSAAKPLYFFLERYMEAYIQEMKAFAEAIAQDTPVPVSGADGRAPVVIGLAALKSFREGRPVKIAEIEPGGGR
jgi:myo-inositol 2-dehydrogenase/D-chiro-inositol 1-dehydrogenase